MIADNISIIRSELPSDVTLVAVSKYYPASDILQAYNAGQRVFGESRANELREKYEQLPKDIQWHFIGHLQKNKVKYIAPFVSLIHSVDNFELLREINRQALLSKRIIDYLLEFRIAEEDSKYGFKSANDVVEMLMSAEFGALHNVRLRGVMGMATFTDNMSKIRNEFASLRSIAEQLSGIVSGRCEVSMGMSNDYKIAVEEGSTMIRIGSAIFDGD
ncbi:MAG: YggS family pyridoxal phosphate-dependent enzyme [Bacteroidales bacterium]|jgi:pyridoxal phosphate enzyme (YggS family)|nr:YggS family pyridoxal phosphate-dependent enzyme [Bacteroidales bacterium]